MAANTEPSGLGIGTAPPTDAPPIAPNAAPGEFGWEFFAVLAGLIALALVAAFVTDRAVRRWWPRRTHPAYAEAARQLGLRAQGERIEGTLGALHVAASAWIVDLSTGSRRNGAGRREERILVTVPFPVPLDLALMWQSRRRYEGYLPGGSMWRLPPPPPALVEWSSREPDRALSLFTPEVRAGFDALRAISFRVEVTDYSVLVESLAPHQAPHIVALTRGAASLVRATLEASTHVPVSRFSAAYLPLWQSLARTYGLHLGHTPLTLSGSLRGTLIDMSVVLRDPTAPSILVRGRFERSLSSGLSIRAKTLQDRLPFIGSEDVKTGDQRFDEAFLVQSRSVELANQLLTPDVRERMHDLHKRHPLRVDDRGVFIDVFGAVPDARVVELLEEVIAMVRAMEATVLLPITSPATP